MSDDAVVQIISRLGVDFNQAIVGVEQLSASTTKLNAELKQLQVSAKEAAQQMGLAFTSTTGKMEATAAKTKAGAVMGEKIKQDFSKKLMETEVLLRKTLADAAKAGAYIPSGTNRSLGYVGALQQQVAAGKELTQQEVKAVDAIGKRARLRQLEIQASVQALKLEQAQAQVVGHVADQQGRVGLAQKQSTELAKMELLTLNQKMARMQATVQTKQLENSLTAIGSKTLGSELVARQAELANLIKQMEVNGKLNAQEMQRLNLLKGQVAALNNNVGAAGAIATADAKQAAAAAKAEKANKKAVDEANKHKKSVQDLNQEYNVLGSQFERRAGWFVAGTAFFGSITAVKEIATTIKDVEMGMTTIARITEDVNFNFEEMRDSLQGLGVEYGMTWENTSDIAIKWAQAGYNTADTLELTKSSLLALNTAELNATQATQGLIAIMAQWGLTAEQLLPTIDKINITAWAA